MQVKWCTQGGYAHTIFVVYLKAFNEHLFTLQKQVVVVCVCFCRKKMKIKIGHKLGQEMPSKHKFVSI